MGPKTIPDIHAIVVESHNHALAHIHEALRKQKRLGQPWSMLHFDSHADLACPGPHVPAYCCFRPSFEVEVDHSKSKSTEDGSVAETAEALDLYELLNLTASGIAEWIMPLVLAADLTEIYWARPKHDMYLIPSGSHCYRVGAWFKSTSEEAIGMTAANNINSFLDLPLEAVVKVDSPLLYYMEDESTAPADELALSQIVNLQVSEESPHEAMTIQSLPYMLDICLDYFCCVNPFIAELELVSPHVTRAFQRAIAATKLAQSASGQDHDLRSGQEALAHCLDFRKALTCVLETVPGPEKEQPHNDALATMFEPFYKSREEGAELIGSLIRELLDCEDARSLSKMVIEAIPYAMMPHDGSIFDQRDEISFHEYYPWIEERLQTFRNIVERQREPPFLVTIARSSNDGFTPTVIVNEIQRRVLRFLDDAYSKHVICFPDGLERPPRRVLVRRDYE